MRIKKVLLIIIVLVCIMTISVFGIISNTNAEAKEERIAQLEENNKDYKESLVLAGQVTAKIMEDYSSIVDGYLTEEESKELRIEYINYILFDVPEIIDEMVEEAE